MSDVNPEIVAARERLAARFSSTVRTGGKGSMRRKKKATHKSSGTDDKRLQSTLKRLGVTPIPAIEEVNLFTDEGNVIHFENPKVQAAVAANTFVVSGSAQVKPMQDMLPDILQQLGADSLTNLKRLAESMGGAAGAGGKTGDDEMPELTGTFDDADDDEEDDEEEEAADKPAKETAAEGDVTTVD
eukprot:CAMPEP_0196782532 /NCGR_PEP_ID=MMETSP1104-20130614/11546_1 /TAXON_ID=33652 /ORGANISM="Cafeteria sp., Strain Caron Lab Isolate" /LENGTH=185 /DNA_ID=CAMNT_0042152771 /DNA_START=106 /DNA_END=663 /DNA_ORIENTATION=+